jgi:ribosomal protein L37AE/L43A
MTPLSSLLNNEHVCGVCRRRAHGLAAGRPGKALWFCDPCGPAIAREIVMTFDQQRLDAIEAEALNRVLDQLPDAIEVAPAERHEFVTWLIREFGTQIRKAARDGHAPF